MKMEVVPNGQRAFLSIRKVGVDAFGDAISTVGTAKFLDALFLAVQEATSADQIAIFTYHPKDGFNTLGVMALDSLSAARSLTRDYMDGYYYSDPNYGTVSTFSHNRKMIIGRHDNRKIKGTDYEKRLYKSTNIIDKIYCIWSDGETVYYLNVYRRIHSGRFSDAEFRRFADWAGPITKLVRQHGARTRLEQAIGVKDGQSVALRLIGLLDESLSPREVEVLALILLGVKTEGIAISLNIMPTTVTTLKKRAYHKLGICSQSELFALCLSAIPKICTTNDF